MPYWLDGNNVAAITAADPAGGRDKRRALLEYLSNLRRRRGGRFVVYFDGDDADRRIPPAGVLVRFAAPLSADAAIIGQLRATSRPREVTVVTNDRELAARSRAAGAETLTWGEFEAQSRPSGAKPVPLKKLKNDEQPVKIRDWQQYFGLSDADLEE